MRLFPEDKSLSDHFCHYIPHFLSPLVFLCHFISLFLNPCILQNCCINNLFGSFSHVCSCLLSCQSLTFSALHRALKTSEVSTFSGTFSLTNHQLFLATYFGYFFSDDDYHYSFFSKVTSKHLSGQILGPISRWQFTYKTIFLGGLQLHGLVFQADQILLYLSK